MLRNDPRWSRVLLVEGVPGAGWSTILDELARKHVARAPERRIRSFVHLTQPDVFWNAEPRGTIST